LRALSGLSRASRDLEALAEAEELSVRQVACLWELSAELAHGLRRLSYVARLQGLSPEAISKAKQE
jgi:hypothetical protein